MSYVPRELSVADLRQSDWVQMEPIAPVTVYVPGLRVCTANYVRFGTAGPFANLWYAVRKVYPADTEPRRPVYYQVPLIEGRRQMLSPVSMIVTQVCPEQGTYEMMDSKGVTSLHTLDDMCVNGITGPVRHALGLFFADRADPPFCPRATPTIASAEAAPSLPNEEAEAPVVDPCSICFEQMDADGAHGVATITPCMHRFGNICIRQWLATGRPTYPLCRGPAPEEHVHFLPVVT